jgi:hypothetical protein
MRRAFILACGILLLTSVACGQGLRISTRVSDLTESDRGVNAVVSRSLSLCHNGRVYDYMDAVNEVVVYDPVERRFSIYNSDLSLSTTISFDEIGQLLESRRPRTDAYLSELSASGKPADARIAESLRFQLNPKFNESFDPMKGHLILTSRSFTYRVETRKWDDAEQVERYLTATDWTARLNSILHPSSLFPEPRLALNASLRKLNDRMPVSVELDLRPDDHFRLKAEHQLTPQLSEDDHSRIARWDQALRSEEVRSVSFRSYQQKILLTRAR